jgi:hypothetical protein
LKYTKAMIEAIELKAEDVVLTSGGGCTTECSTDCTRQTSPDCPRELF